MDKIIQPGIAIICRVQWLYQVLVIDGINEDIVFLSFISLYFSSNTASPPSLPVALNISQNGRTIIINWYHESNRYYFQLRSSQSEDNENWNIINESSITLNLTKTTKDIVISLCPERTNTSTFIIGNLVSKSKPYFLVYLESDIVIE